LFRHHEHTDFSYSQHQFAITHSRQGFPLSMPRCTDTLTFDLITVYTDLMAASCRDLYTVPFSCCLSLAVFAYVICIYIYINGLYVNKENYRSRLLTKQHNAQGQCFNPLSCPSNTDRLHSKKPFTFDTANEKYLTDHLAKSLGTFNICFLR
jgi:hypothetical protein